MKNLYKTLIVMLIIMMASFSLVACGGVSDGGNEDAGGETVSHIFELVPAKEPTCTEDGNIQYYKCTECDKFFSEESADKVIADKKSVIIPRLGHDYKDGFCTRCGAVDPHDQSFIDGDKIKGVTVTEDGVLAWGKLKNATKYVVNLKLADGDHSFEVDKKLARLDVNNLPDNIKLQFGRNRMSITSYVAEKVELNVSNMSTYKETEVVEIPGDTFVFDIINTNNEKKVVGLNYADNYITLEGFEAEQRTDESGNKYIYGEEIFKNSGDDKQGYNLSKKIKLVDNSLAMKIYKSAYDRENNRNAIDGFDWYNEQINAGKNSYYVRIIDAEQNAIDYTVVICGIKYVNIKLYTFTTHDFEGEIVHDFNEIDGECPVTKVLQNDYLDINALYEYIAGKNGVSANPVIRNYEYKTYLKDTDILIPVDGNLGYTFLVDDTDVVKEKTKELDYYKQDYDLRVYQGGADLGATFKWILSYKGEHAVNKDLLVPSKIIGFNTMLTSYSFRNGSGIKTVTIMPGIKDLPENTFKGCTSLEKVCIPSTVDSYGDYMFDSAVSETIKIYCEDARRDINDLYYDWNRIPGTQYYIPVNYAQYHICDEITSEGVTYRVSVAENLAGVTEIAENSVIKESIRYGYTEFPVKRIEGNSYKNNTTVTVPAFITEINFSAFGDNMESVVIDENNTVFASRDGIVYDKAFTTMKYIPTRISGEIVVPETVKYLMHFKNNALITKVTLPDCNMPEEMFSGCTALKEVVFNGEESVDNPFVIVEKNVFFDCTSLTSIVLPANVKKINAYAFKNCTSLKSINLDNIEVIYRNAFENCGFTSVVVPDGVKKLYPEIFINCKNLTDCTLPSGLTSVPMGIFQNTAIKEIRLPAGVTEIGENVYKNCLNIETLNIPANITSIGNNAFSYCKNLKTLDLSDVTSLGKGAFSHCDSLTTLNIPDTLKVIGESAFFSCLSLDNLVVPETVTLGQGAFNSCTGLKTLTFIRDNVNIDDFIFNNCKNIETIYTNPAVIGCIDSNKLKNVYLVAGTTINYAAFYQTSTITNVYISESITSVGKDAFYGCNNATFYCGASAQPTGWASNWNYGRPVFWNVKELGENENYSFFVTNDNVATISDYIGSEKDVVIPSEIELKGTVYPVQHIKKECFKGIKTINSIVVPETILTIGDSAFESMGDLNELTIKSDKVKIENKIDYKTNLRTFNAPVNIVPFIYKESIVNLNITSGNEIYDNFSRDNGISFVNLEKVTLPETITRIGLEAFNNCQRLTSINIPKGVTTISNSAFKDCISLKDVVIPFGVENMGDYAFYNLRNTIKCEVGSKPSTWSSYWVNKNTDVVWGVNNLTTDDGNFNYIEGKDGIYITKFVGGVTDVVLPDKIDNIPVVQFGEIFRDNKTITSMVISDGVKSIPNSAFSGCEALTNITVGDGVTVIKDYAFANCTSLKSISFGKNVVEIYPNTMSGCVNLETMAVDPLNTTYKVDGNCLIHIETSAVIRGLDNSVIPDYVKVIDDNSFAGCKNITEIKIPVGVTKIGTYAFHDCTSLTSVVIPDTVTIMSTSVFEGCGLLKTAVLSDNLDSIPVATFKNCHSLSSVNIPSKCTYIEGHAFYGCDKLARIILPTAMRNIGGHAFENSGLKDIKINDGLETIGIDAFSSSDIGRIITPWTVKSIENGAFEYCHNLSLAALDIRANYGRKLFDGCENVTVLLINTGHGQGERDYHWNTINGNEVITAEQCTALQYKDGFTYAKANKEKEFILDYDGVGGDVKIPAWFTSGYFTVQDIGTAFIYNDTITSVTIPRTVGRIAPNAFRDCVNLVTVDITSSSADWPATVNSIGNDAFNGCVNLTTINIDNNSKIANIGERAFYNCNKLTTIYLSDALKTIGASAFENCKTLDNITLPGGIALIEGKAFGNCTELKNLKFNSGIVKVDYQAFYHCDGLTTVFLPKGIDEMCYYVFDQCDRNLKIYCEDASKPTKWSSGFAGYCEVLWGQTAPAV